MNSVKADHSYGVSALVGFNLNDSTSLFGRVGYQRGRVTSKEEGEKFSATRDGLRFGAGVETSLSESLSLRAQYSRTHYYLSDADKVDLDGAKGGVNNDQFALSVITRF